MKPAVGSMSRQIPRREVRRLTLALTPPVAAFFSPKSSKIVWTNPHC